MTSQQMKENLIRSEGYAQGFKDGYANCTAHILEQMQKEEKEKEPKKE